MGEYAFSYFSKKIIIGKSTEIIYGLRNFIGNANKFSKKKVDIFIITIKNKTLIKIIDDGKGFPKDLINPLAASSIDKYYEINQSTRSIALRGSVSAS